LRRPVRLVPAVACALALAVAAPAGAQDGPPACVGDTDTDSVPQLPGPHLRFGVNPRAVTGQIGPLPAPAVPEDPDRHLAKLGQLRPAGGPFVLRLTRFFWSDGEEGFARFLEMAGRYTLAGYLVELQVRYHPREDQEGDIAAWVEHVREVVRRFGPNPGVVGLQIANEVNITFSPDSSDGAYEGAREALVRGVIAAKDEARRHGYDQLRIGFNWAYRTDPAGETSFWQALRDRGGPEFVRSLDYIGLDAYPGTVFPPAEPEGSDYRDGMVNAMSAIRCYSAIPGIPRAVPIEIGENGWPTTPGRSYEEQANILREMVRAVHDFRGTYNVTDYRWFNLRDSQTGAPQVFQNAGLLEDDYDEKPAFAVYRDLVSELTVANPERRARRRARVALRLRFRPGRTAAGRRCARGPVRATVVGRRARRATFFRDGRRVARDTRRPLSRVVDRQRRRWTAGRHRVRVGVRLAGGRLVRLARTYRGCFVQ
jgi:hypothetical protein